MDNKKNYGGFFLNTKGALPLYTSQGIKYPHGFSTRDGGVSREPHLGTLNLGYSLGDDPDSVTENRRRFAAALGAFPEKIISAKQIHSADVRYVTESDCGSDFECDGFVTDRRGVILTVKTADCTPILFCDDKNGIIGAVHAGWRGTAAGIAAECVKKMILIGAAVHNIHAAIGACIHFCCYEVDEPFRKAFSDEAGEDIAAAFICSGNYPEGKYHADLPGINRELLIRDGLSDRNISVCEECTCCKPEVFFSHRASNGKRGVMMAGIMID